MISNDINLTCKECGQDFVFSSEEQEFYNEKGFTQPKKCSECRARNRQRRQGGGRPMNRKRFEVICSKCGISTTVPFEPKEDKPVYCPDCYRTEK